MDSVQYAESELARIPKVNKKVKIDGKIEM